MALPDYIYDQVVNLPLYWLDDGLYIGWDTEEFRKGDKIVQIGGLSTERLLDEFKQLIPAENEGWVKQRAANSMSLIPYLEELKLINNNQVAVKVIRENEKKTIILHPQKIENIANTGRQNTTINNYVIEEEYDYGILTLYTCKNDAEYKDLLDKFFLDVSVKKIVIDVRQNGGGDSSVVEEFLRYIDIPQYYMFQQQARYSQQLKEQYPSLSMENNDESIPIHINSRHPNPYSSELYVFTSNRTFSSANWFGVLVQDNKLGKVVGEPTGNQPTTYGDPLQFQMPNSQLRFFVSAKKFIRPDRSKNTEDALYPDVPISRRIDNILQGKDPLLEYIKQLK